LVIFEYFYIFIFYLKTFERKLLIFEN
jgi:hypothetical protein